MTASKIEFRLRSRFWGIVASGMFWLVVLLVCLSAEGAASASQSGPISLGNRNRQGAVKLPGGMDPMDVVRTVDRNREGASRDTSGAEALLTRYEVGPPFHIGGEPVYGPAARDQELSAVGFDGTNYLVVWSDSRSGGGDDYDIYGARVSVGGAVLDSVGIAISTAANSQYDPAIAFDGTNYLVVWQNLRSGSWDIYGARVSVGGVVLDPEGIAISTAANSQYVPAIAFDGTNYLVVWDDQRTGTDDIYGARVSVGGVVLDPGEIAISLAVGNQTRPAITFDGTNYLVVWSDSRSGGSSNYDIYGARVSVGGVVLDATGIAVSTSAYSQSDPAVAFDGTNYLVVWTEYRIGDDIYGARVSVGGVVLDPGGIAISTCPMNQVDPAVGFDGTNYLVVWEDRRGGGPRIYGARVGVGGVVLDPEGMEIATNATAKRGPSSIGFDGTNYLVVWGDALSGWNVSDSDIYGARVSVGGIVLDPGGIAISTASNDQQYPAVGFDGTNYLVVWSDHRSRGTYDIYGARVSVGGIVLDPAGIAISTAANSQYAPAIAFDGTNYLVVWDDERGGDLNDNIYGARVSVGGVVLDSGGIAISTATDRQEDPAIAFDGTNYLIVWEDRRGQSYYDIYGARVSVGGVVLDSGGIAISTAGWYEETDPAVGFDGTNYLVVWEDGRSGTHIYGARVSVGGGVLDPGGIAISTYPISQVDPAVGFDGTNYLVVWQHIPAAYERDIHGARVSVGGVVLDPGPGIAISTASNDQRYPAVAFDSLNYLVVWQDYRGGSSWDIYGARVSVEGAVLDANGIAIATGVTAQLNPAMGSGPTGQRLVAGQSFGPTSHGCYRIWGNMWERYLGPDCLVQPGSIDFGRVTVGSSKDTTFTITNTGGGTLSGSVSEPCAQYSIVSGGGSYSLGGGQSRVVTVRFAPTSGGTHNCTVETGSGLCSDVSLTGVGEPLPACAVSPTSIEVGTVFIGSSKDTTFTITNTGGGTLSGSVSEPCAQYSIVSGGGSYSLGGGQSRVVTVRFQPTSRGTHNCTVETGSGLCSNVSLTGVGEPLPACAVSPTSIDVGTVFIGGSKDTTFTITNTGGGLLTGTVTDSACLQFSLVHGDTTYSLAASGTLTVDVRFEPTAEGVASCSIETGNGMCSDVMLSGFGGANLIISSIVDVANDQGRQVRLNFLRSSRDSAGSPTPILQYKVFRRSEILPLVFGSRSGMRSDRKILAEEWDSVAAVPAHGQLVYNVIVPTLADSTAEHGTFWSAFYVRATTANSMIFFNSPIDSGYSVDNLVPGVPEGFVVIYNSTDGNVLSWNPSDDHDFSCFRIYRGVAPDFVPGAEHLVHSTSEVNWVDDIDEGWRYYYKITAVDNAGNESVPASAEITTAIPRHDNPTKYALYQNVPNPFNPIAAIRYDVPFDGGRVTLKVFDVTGRLVVTLVDAVESSGRKTAIWNGKDQYGVAVGSGVYFYRLQAPGYEKTLKMLLLQ